MTRTFLVTLELTEDDLDFLDDIAQEMEDELGNLFDVVSVEPWEGKDNRDTPLSIML